MTFEKSILDLADEYFPIEQDFPRKINKRASTTCPGGNGKFGFNSYQMLKTIFLNLLYFTTENYFRDLVNSSNYVVNILQCMSSGQLISKCHFGVFKSPKKPTKHF